jgi:biopolymer transport protein ExbD
VFVEHRAEDRRRFDRQILQAFIVTMAGFWIVVLLVVWTVTPLYSPSVWPLLELPFASTGRKAPDMERDVWASVRANGDLFIGEKKVDVPVLPGDDASHVFVRADRAAPFGAVRTLVRAAQRAGRKQLTFMAVPADPQKFAEPAPLSCTDPGVSPPVILQHRNPDFGDLRHPQYGAGIFELSVDPAGGVTAVRVVRGVDPAIDEKIVKAAMQWKFRPATHFGNPIACVLNVQLIIDVR